MLTAKTHNMKTIKRILGLVWMALGPLAIIFLYLQAVDKVALAHTDIERSNTTLQWGIILFIFIPINRKKVETVLLRRLSCKSAKALGLYF